jgi:hypothetical protein
VTEIVDEEEQSSKGNGPVPFEPAVHRDAGARAGDARARDEQIVTDGDDEPPPDADLFDLEALINLWADQAKATSERIWAWLTGDRGVLSEHPASPADLFAYWWHAPMAGKSSGLRWVQRIDALLVAAPGAAGFRAAGWLWERPLRRYLFILLAFITWRYS